MLRLLEQQEAVAQQVLPRGTYDYYAGGAGEELTLEANLAAWRAARLRPRGLRDVADVSTAATVLGASLSAPVLVAPSALHGLAGPGAEADTARGARAAGSLMVLSMRSSVPMERVAEALDGAPWWFQVYALRDGSLTLELVTRAVTAGAAALVLTADSPVVGMKKRPNEGLSIEQLHLVAAAVRGRGPVLVDGGIRSGLDVLVALALGADAVLLGRPVLWALAAGGSQGVRDCLDAVRADLAHVLAGARSVTDLPPGLLAAG